jgi:hypothetical protein
VSAQYFVFVDNMADLHRTRSNAFFNGDEMPALPIARLPVGEDKKSEVKAVTFQVAAQSLSAFLAECPKKIKPHVLQMRLLQWQHGFELTVRDEVDAALMCYLHDYDVAMKKNADAMVVSRMMLNYAMPITKDPGALLKRDKRLEELCREYPYKATVYTDKGGSSEKKKGR